MTADDVPWHDLAALQALAASEALSPAPAVQSPDGFHLVRAVNERLVALTPAEYKPPLRISRVYKYWAEQAQLAGSFDEARHNRELRSTWLIEALVRNPPAGTRRAILGALGTHGRQAERRAAGAVTDLASTSFPRELVRLARSLREDRPQLPHLACVASERAVVFADRAVPHKSVRGFLAEPYEARCSLAASLRRCDRPGDAERWAREAVGMGTTEVYGWTVLIAATREAQGPKVAVGVIGEAVAAIGEIRARRDAKFARAAVKVFEDVGDHLEAGAWWVSVANDDRPGREAALDRARGFLHQLRSQARHVEAEQLDGLIRSAQTTLHGDA